MTPEAIDILVDAACENSCTLSGYIFPVFEPAIIPESR